MAISIHSELNQLQTWVSGGTSQREAEQRFDSLPGADPAGLAGLWRGRSLPTGHPFDGLLETLGWYGKQILPDGRVRPLLFRRPSGRIVALSPAWMPVAIALRWPALAHSPAARVAFQALGPMLTARGTSAQIEVRELHGQHGAAIVYDRQPIVDRLRSLDAGRLVGRMERRGMAAPYFFLLWRETALPAPPAGLSNTFGDVRAKGRTIAGASTNKNAAPFGTADLQLALVAGAGFGHWLQLGRASNLQATRR